MFGNINHKIIPAQRHADDHNILLKVVTSYRAIEDESGHPRLTPPVDYLIATKDNLQAELHQDSSRDSVYVVKPSAGIKYGTGIIDHCDCLDTSLGKVVNCECVPCDWYDDIREIADNYFYNVQ